MPINPNLLRIAVMKQAEKVLVREVRPLVKLDFEERKKEFLQAFDEDEVTQELEDGPDAFSRVPELAEMGGNLFSFLGFHRGTNPVAALREYIKDNVVLYKTKAGKISGNRIVFETQFISPTEAEVDNAVASHIPLDWTSRAFTNVLAKGVPGLPQFLAKHLPSPEPSRSGGGIQTKKNLRAGNAPKIPYIKRLLSVLGRIVKRES